MSDRSLLERLRDSASRTMHGVPRDLLNEGADEIARLQRQLLEHAEVCKESAHPISGGATSPAVIFENWWRLREKHVYQARCAQLAAEAFAAGFASAQFSEPTTAELRLSDKNTLLDALSYVHAYQGGSQMNAELTTARLREMVGRLNGLAPTMIERS